MNVETNINKSLEYAEKLIGIKYQYWSESTKLSDNEPMWVSNDRAPDVEDIRNTSINCTGLINLMRRSIELPIPGLETRAKYPGGIYQWYKYLKSKGVLKKFNYTLDYPRGTLFLRKYTSEYDQGHVSVLYTENIQESLYSIIIHSSTNCEFNVNTKLEPGVNIYNTLGQSHFYDKFGYYQYYCLPEDWLN